MRENKEIAAESVASLEKRGAGAVEATQAQAEAPSRHPASRRLRADSEAIGHAFEPGEIPYKSVAARNRRQVAAHGLG